MAKSTAAVLRNSGLFTGTTDGEIASICRCMDARSYRYAPGEYLFRSGDSADSLGVVLDGRVDVVKQDWWGNSCLLSSYGTGGIICAERACSAGACMDASAVSVGESEVMFFDVGRITTMCPSSCEFHARMIRNLVQVLARESLELSGRLDQMSRRSTRDKVRAFLSDQARAAGGPEFTIPMNRQEMADYLGVDRSALSAELSRMRGDGILEFSKNRFRLLRSAPAVPLGHELVEEADHVVVPGVRHAAGRRGVHHAPEQQELLVEVVDRRAPVGAVLGLRHALPGGLPGDVHGAAPAPAVGEGPGYADGAYRVHPVGVLHYHALEGVGGAGVRPLERHLGYGEAHRLPGLLRDVLRVHEPAGVREPLGAEELRVVGVVKQRRQADDGLVAPLLAADPQRQVVHPLAVVEVVPAAVALEQAPYVVLGAAVGPLVHAE